MRMVHDLGKTNMAGGMLKCCLGVGDDAGRPLACGHVAANVWDVPYR